MLKYVIAYLSTAALFLAVDFVWLSIMANGFYRSRIPDVIGTQANYPAAIAFYLIFVAGIVIFAVSPALENGRWTTALVYGALFGFMAYATYDLTNQATLKQWSTMVTIVDMGWGTFASALCATLSLLFTRWLLATV
ncbi:DUF2177 family protein [Phyllobacterium calauticae]|jgi:uncharacterized membrane protein|uniref:DUF2177 family protein n=1 Tax=Phyllobacterium calauticae TaxID=2817027 RepID=UPI001CBFE891|nr:DUF2177 family protein [Phyllobacterium calauticae]MBZ3695671.1 DUF2177 family protein [Phyllobacterium calauticae]